MTPEQQKIREAAEKAFAQTEQLSPLYGARLVENLIKTLTAAGLMMAAPPEDFQSRVHPWMMECFGEEISKDKRERCDRFIEEALELVQAIGYDKERCYTLVDYVFGRPIGESAQEVGGVMVTLAALCLATDLNMHNAGETELTRIWTKVEQIRKKQEGKRGLHTALPVAPEVHKLTMGGFAEGFRAGLEAAKNELKQMGAHGTVGEALTLSKARDAIAALPLPAEPPKSRAHIDGMSDAEIGAHARALVKAGRVDDLVLGQRIREDVLTSAHLVTEPPKCPADGMTARLLGTKIANIVAEHSSTIMIAEDVSALFTPASPSAEPAMKADYNRIMAAASQDLSQRQPGETVDQLGTMADGQFKPAARMTDEEITREFSSLAHQCGPTSYPSGPHLGHALRRLVFAILDAGREGL